MAYDGWGFMGFHFFWWLLWIALLLGFVLWVARTAGGAGRAPRTPLEISQRHYASGVITQDEHEEQRRTLERNATR